MADVNVVKVIEQLEKLAPFETLAPFDDSTRKKLKDLFELG